MCTDSANQVIQEVTSAVGKHIDPGTFTLIIEEQYVTSSAMCYCDTDRCNIWSGDQIKMADETITLMTLPAAATPTPITDKGNITLGVIRILFVGLHQFISKLQICQIL